MNADLRVVEFLGGPRTRSESDETVDRMAAHIDEHGYGYWAVEILGVTKFAGFIGLRQTQFAAHFTPAVDLGWRLSFEHWNKGYATEGARAALDFGFNKLKLNEIVSFTSPENVRSRRVMEKIEMTHDPRDDFEHPNLPEGHRLRRHVLYRKRRR
jgi:RimJ/RimL family protein N-acetyltransferase